MQEAQKHKKARCAAVKVERKHPLTSPTATLLTFACQTRTSSCMTFLFRSCGRIATSPLTVDRSRTIHHLTPPLHSGADWISGRVVCYAAEGSLKGQAHEKCQPDSRPVQSVDSEQVVLSSSWGTREMPCDDEVSGCVALVTALGACMLHAAREPGLCGIPASVALSKERCKPDVPVPRSP